MKLIKFAAACLFLFSVLSPLSLFGQEKEEGQKSPPPRIATQGVFQFWWQWEEKDTGQDQPGREQFQTRRLHLSFLSEPLPQTQALLTLSLVSGDTLGVKVYEAWVKKELSPSWSLQFGYFLPPWTLTMPRPVRDLEFIRYPLIVDPGEWLFTPWQQTGVMLSAHPGENFFFAVGLMNGLDAAGFLFDDNNMKDTMVVVGFRPLPGLRLHLGHWGGRTELRSVTLAPGEQVALPFGLSATNTTPASLRVGGGVVEHNSTWLGIEILSSSLLFSGEALWHRADRDGENLLHAQGYHLSLVYSRNKYQALLRYEQYEPDTRDSGQAKDDEMEWTTLGFNYQPLPSTRIMLNYIFKSERGDNQKHNNELLLQLSLFF